MKPKLPAEQSTSLCDTKFKIVFLGDSGTGKTSIIQRFTRNEFDASSSSTVGIDFLSRNMTLGNRTFRLQLWDTAGQQKYKSLVPAYLRDANAAIFVYDVNRPQSLENVPAWLQLFRDHQTPNAVAVLVGTKMDLVSDGINPLKEQAQKLALRDEMTNYQVSAKEGKCINRLFSKTVQLLAQVPKQQDLQAQKIVQKLKSAQIRTSCCL